MKAGAATRASRLREQGWDCDVLFDSLLEVAPIGVAIVSGPDNRLELVNPAYCRLVGWPEEAIIGRALRDVSSGARAQAVERYIAEVYGTARTVTVREVPLETGAPPCVSYWNVDYVPLLSPTNQVRAVLMLATSVTEKVQARHEGEAFAREAEERAAQRQAVLAAVSEPLLVFDAAGRMTYANDAAAHQLGLGPGGELLPQLAAFIRTLEILRPDGAPISDADRYVQRALRGEAFVGEEFRYRPGAAAPSRWGRASAAPIRDGQGRISGVVLTASDITAEKEAQAERERLLATVEVLARQAEERAAQLQAVLASISDSISVYDATGHPVFVNEATARQLGLEPTPEVMRGLEAIIPDLEVHWPDGTLIAPEDRQAIRALRGETVIGEEVLFRPPSGGPLRWARVSAAPVRDGQGRVSGVVVTATDITAQKEAQVERERLLAQALSAQEKLQTILARLPDGVVVFDRTMHVTLTNVAIHQFLGYDLVGMSFADLDRTFQVRTPRGEPVPEEERPFRRVPRGESVTGMEVAVTLPDGRHYDMLISSAPLRDVEGHITGAVLAATDITMQKQAQTERERLLAEVDSARRNLRTVIDQMPGWVMVADPASRVVLANDAIRRFLGHEVEGMRLGQMWSEYGRLTGSVAPFPKGETPFHKALRGEVVTGVEVPATERDGRPVCLLVSAVPLRDAEGRITAVVVTTADITRQKEAQAERERLLGEVEGARASLQAILNRLPDGVLVVDSDLRVTLSNETVRQYLGYDPQGSAVSDLHAEMRLVSGTGQPFPEGQTPIERALRGEPVLGVEAGTRLPDGRHVDVLVSAASLRGPEGRVREVALVLTDVTPLKQLDRAKDEFISVAAHELRTPLTSLKGHTQLLQRKASREKWRPEDLRSLETIDDQVDRLNELIGRLLDVSRIRLGRLQLHRQRTDIVALAHEVAEDMQVTTEAHRISLEAVEPQILGSWDPAALRQVLTNLVGNAIKYAPGGLIAIRIRRQDDRIVVSVSDQGPGIPPEQQARLFEAFRRGAAEEYRRAGGLGLGLYISRGIVEAHGGHIWVDSKVGVGTTFTFALPPA